jgi:NADH:ubiquinone oxidoreductase subunit K
MEDGEWIGPYCRAQRSSILYPLFSHPREVSVTPLTAYLLLSALLFAIGLAGALTRRNAILVLVGIELMLNAANLNFIAFWRYGPHPEALTGVMFVIFSIGVAAAEAAVGLALIISIYRHYRTTNLEQMDSLRG